MIVTREKSKAWGGVGREIEKMLCAWCSASGIKEDEVLRRVNDETFCISCAKSEEYMSVVLRDAEGKIGKAFTWFYNGEGTLESYKLDLSLVLASLRERVSSTESRQKIKKFIIDELS